MATTNTKRSRTSLIEDVVRVGCRVMPTAETAFVAKIREQIEFLHNEEYSYDELHIYVSGAAEPWEFGRTAEFDFDGDEVLVVRVGPTEEWENEGVPEIVFPIRHIVATQLAVSESEE